MLCNSFIIKHIGGGKIRHLYSLLLVCALCSACSSPAPKSQPAAQTETSATEVVLSTAMLYSRDSLLYYAERAYTLDDPKGQYVIAAASYLQQQGEVPPELYTISQDEADTMLMRSAAQGYQPAIESIRCLKECGMWRHN